MYYSSYNRSEEGCAEDDIQKESIFQTRCLVLGNVCSLIIDGGSCIMCSLLSSFHVSCSVMKQLITDQLINYNNGKIFFKRYILVCT